MIPDRRKHSFGWGVVSLYLCIGAVLGHAQEAESGPLRLEWRLTGPLDGQTLVWKVTNVSAADVVGYSLRVECGGPEQCVFSRNELWVSAKPPQDRLRPQESREQQRGVPIKGGAAKVTVDYVLFADGSGWGADRGGQSLWLRGTFSGWKQAHARLRNLLATGGAEAVVQALKQEQ